MTREEAKRLLEKMMPQQRSDIKSIPHLMITEAFSVAIKALEQQPTRPTGKWIEKEDYNLDTYYECSECGADYCIEGDILIHKYCPNCGARMEESEGDECR